MPELVGSQTEANLRAALAAESEANRRYLYFAQRADVEGHPEIAALFRSVAEGETGHAFGHLDFLTDGVDASSDEGSTAGNLREAIARETREHTEMYPDFARVAREEGFAEVAEWLETLARAERSHAGRFQQGLDDLS